MIWTTGGKYTGFWKEDKCNGLGTYVYANNDVDVGMYKDDKINGFGKFTYGQGKYIGFIKNNI